MSKVDLKLDWCSYRAAKFAVEHWHYSHVLPAGKAVFIGAWEDREFVGCVCFSRGANNHIGNPYHLSQTEVCELTRIALNVHQSTVSRITSIAIRMLQKQSPGLRLLVSYADPEQHHHGGIYQAMGWIYVGLTKPNDSKYLLIDGNKVHAKSAYSIYGSNDAGKLNAVWQPSSKHKYLYPLDDAMRKQILPLAKPYPKRAASVDSGTSGVQPEGSGAIPTAALNEVQ